MIGTLLRPGIGLAHWMGVDLALAVSTTIYDLHRPRAADPAPAETVPAPAALPHPADHPEDPAPGLDQ